MDTKEPRKEQFGMYDLQYLVRRIIKKFGHDVEKYDTIRAIIDDQYYNKT